MEWRVPRPSSGFASGRIGTVRANLPLIKGYIGSALVRRPGVIPNWLGGPIASSESGTAAVFAASRLRTPAAR